MQNLVSHFFKLFILSLLITNTWSLECLTIDEQKIIGLETETVLSIGDCSDEQIQTDLKLLNSPDTDNDITTADYQYSAVTIGQAHTLLNTDHTESNGSELYLAEDLIKILNYHTDSASEEVFQGTLITEETTSETELTNITMSFIILLNAEKTKLINLQKLESVETITKPTTF